MLQERFCCNLWDLQQFLMNDLPIRAVKADLKVLTLPSWKRSWYCVWSELYGPINSYRPFKNIRTTKKYLGISNVTYCCFWQGCTTDTDIRGRIRINGYGYVIFSFWTDTDIEAYPFPFIRFIRIFCALDKMASNA